MRAGPPKSQIWGVHTLDSLCEPHAGGMKARRRPAHHRGTSDTRGHTECREPWERNTFHTEKQGQGRRPASRGVRCGPAGSGGCQCASPTEQTLGVTAEWRHICVGHSGGNELQVGAPGGRATEIFRPGEAVPAAAQIRTKGGTVRRGSSSGERKRIKPHTCARTRAGVCSCMCGGLQGPLKLPRAQGHRGAQPGTLGRVPGGPGTSFPLSPPRGAPGTAGTTHAECCQPEGPPSPGVQGVCWGSVM